MLPRLHLVTDDTVLGEPGFANRARAVLEAHGDVIALHLRGHTTHAASLFCLARELAATAAAVGSTLLVNDRVDIALAAGADGVQIGQRSLPIAVGRGLLGAERWIGYSAHGEAEARAAVTEGADFVLFGAIHPTASHPARVAVGIAQLRNTTAAVDGPVVAIGGITPERATEVSASGAYGVAVLSGVWRASNALAALDAVSEYRSALHL